MKAFIILAIAAIGYAAPAADPQLLQSGLPAGPLTPAWGDLVATPRGARPLHLEGFSEDVNQDGFVDPIAQAVVAAPVIAPYHVPYAYPWAGLPVAPVAEVKTVEAPKPVAVAATAPVIAYAGLPTAYHHAGFPTAYHHAGFPTAYHHVVHQPIATHTYTVPISTKTEVIQVGTHVSTHHLPHVLGAPFLGGPIIAAPAEKPAEGDPAIVEA